MVNGEWRAECGECEEIGKWKVEELSGKRPFKGVYLGELLEALGGLADNCLYPVEEVYEL